MDNDAMTLQERISFLEKENQFLRSLLDKAGIDYMTSSDALQGENVPLEITHTLVRRFFSYFWGRTDVFSKRSQNRHTGKAGYFPQCDNFWKRGICPKASGEKVKCKECNCKAWTKLEAAHVEAHLRGMKEDASDVIGIYPLFPDGTCRFLVFDFDNHSKGAEENDFANLDESWKDEVDSLREICRLHHIPNLTERSRSGQGAHVWVFFDTPIPAALARRFGFALLDKGAEAVNLKSFRFYDRMLPAQEQLDEGEVGNLIALPLQGRALQNGNSAFVDDNWQVIPDQWNALLSTERLNAKYLEQLIEEWKITQQSGERSLVHDDTKPWEKTAKFHKEDVDGTMEIVLANKVYVATNNLKPRIQNQIRRLAAISNPEFFKNQAMGLSNYARSRMIYLGEDEDGYIAIPRGLLERLSDSCKLAHIEVHIEDKRSEGRKIDVSFTGTLRDNQKQAMDKLLKYDCGILSAATAFGKTVTCSNMIAEKKLNTLIVLESSALVEQWEKALNTFLMINEEAPEYLTKTGRVKKRKSVIGVIHNQKDTSTGIIDIAMAGSLYKRGEPHPRLREYGIVIVDECHHSASETVKSVLNEVSARYVYGVTATPFRGDGLEKVNYMLLGPVRFQYTAKEKAMEQGIEHWVVPRFTRTVMPRRNEKSHVNDAYEAIRDNEKRNEQILCDIKKCVSEGRTPVVLTRYTEHATYLYEKAKNYADKVFLLIGTKTKREQTALRNAMENVSSSESMILIATGQLVGEGFDFPRLDTLIMATPVAWKGIVEQYAGRLNRDYPGKENVMIYDYVDCHIRVFDNMYAKRLRAYKRIGYQIYVGGVEEKQQVNAIYDADNYTEIYENDLQQAKKEIIISSPRLGKDKVNRLIHLSKERQEAGVQVTVVTWHPEAYLFGSEAHRLELMEQLRQVGIQVKLVEEHCEHYAVIDREIVWYGSMNLLSKDDADDNIMRVVSGEIAEELLEMTF